MNKAISFHISTHNCSNSFGTVSTRNYALVFNSDLQIREYILKKLKDCKVYINQIYIQRTHILTVNIHIFQPTKNLNKSLGFLTKYEYCVKNQLYLRSLFLRAGLDVSKLEKTLSTFCGLASTVFIKNYFNDVNIRKPDNKQRRLVGGLPYEELLVYTLKYSGAQVLATALASEILFKPRQTPTFESICNDLTVLAKKIKEVCGFILIIKGRVNGADRKRTIIYKFGITSGNRVDLQIGYGFAISNTVKGIVAVHCYILQKC